MPLAAHVAPAEEAVLIAVVLLFAWNLGAHYTGATMPRAAARPCSAGSSSRSCARG